MIDSGHERNNDGFDDAAPVLAPIGHRSASVCHLGNIAIRTGRKITWDPAAEKIIGDEDATRFVHRPYRSPWALPNI